MYQLELLRITMMPWCGWLGRGGTVAGRNRNFRWDRHS